MTKKYLLMIGTDTYEIYIEKDQEPLETFLKECNYHLNNSNKESFKKHWLELIDLLNQKQYVLTEHFDFRGVKKII